MTFIRNAGIVSFLTLMSFLMLCYHDREAGDLVATFLVTLIKRWFLLDSGGL